MNSLFAPLLSILLYFSIAANADNPVNGICEKSKFAKGWGDKYRLLVLGEVHGTNESPEFVKYLMCGILQGAEPLPPIIVGLEYPSGENLSLQTFLNSREIPPDTRSTLTSSGFWQQPFQDGRSSQAIYRLINDIRMIRQLGYKIDVYPYVPSYPNGDNSIDEQYADAINHLTDRFPESLVIVLTGNLHAKKSAEMKKMASYLTAKNKSILLVSSGGTAWACTPKCGLGTLKGDGQFALEKSEEHSDLLPTNDVDYDGYLYLGNVTASLPAALSIEK